MHVRMENTSDRYNYPTSARLPGGGASMPGCVCPKVNDMGTFFWLKGVKLVRIFHSIREYDLLCPSIWVWMCVAYHKYVYIQRNAVRMSCHQYKLSQNYENVRDCK